MATKTNFEVNGRKYFKITRTIGHEIVDGKTKPIKKVFYGTSKTQAEKKYQEWLIEQEQLKSQAVDSNKPLGTVIEYYIDNVFSPSRDYEESTKERYVGAYRRFQKNDGTRLLLTPIQSVTSSDIQTAYNRFDTKQSSLNSLNSFLGGFFRWGVMSRYCNDVLSPVAIPKKPKTVRSDDIEVWTDDELELIDQITVGNRIRLMTFIGRYAGLRVSEVLGLKYSDFTEDTIKVRRQDYRGDLKAPKYNSVRDIPLHPRLKEEFEIHRKWHEQEMKKVGYKTDFLFTTNLGTRYDDSGIRKRFRKLYAANDMENKKFHAFRHTFCTNLCRAGVPIQVASKLMGHKSVEVTAKFYTLVEKDEQRNAIALLK